MCFCKNNSGNRHSMFICCGCKHFRARPLILYLILVCSCLQFLSHPLDNVISPQNSAFLYCNVTGLPIPTISWFKVKSGQLSNGSDYILYENGTLEIINFNSNKNGQYYCVASTSFGSVRSLDAHLQVAGNHSLL